MTTPMRNPRVPGVFSDVFGPAETPTRRTSPAAAVHAAQVSPRPRGRATRTGEGSTAAGAVPRGAVLAAVLFALAGCQATDPLYREGLWRPTGANDANLRAMVAVPSDLAWGAAAPGGDGHLAARAVQRLRQGRTHPLHDVAISKIAPPRSGAAGSAAPAGAEAE